MDTHRGYRDERVPLRRFGEPDPGGRSGAGRDGIRHVRRMSNWTAAVLIVGTGAAAAALAHQASPASVAAAGTAPQASGAGTAASGTGTTARGAGGPQVTHSVATTTASGVTVTTTTRTVNGRTIITQARRPPAHADD
jgi:hypothetical protein